MSLLLLKRFAPHLIVLAAIGILGWQVYAAGARSVQAKWDAADRIAADALLVANTKTALVTDRADVISTDIGATLDARLNTRADSSRFDSLRLCESPGAGRGDVSAVPDSPAQPSGPRASEGSDGSAQRLGKLSAAAIDACRAVTAADELWFEWAERQAENAR